MDDWDILGSYFLEHRAPTFESNYNFEDINNLEEQLITYRLF